MKYCSIEGCDKPSYYHGLCSAHYRHWNLENRKAGPHKICSFQGCNDIVAARNLCEKHYKAYRKSKDFALSPRKRKTCRINGCDNLSIARGLCQKHYARWQSTGDPLKTKTRSFERHGMRNTSEFSIWNAMIQRCYNPKHTAYMNYGGRGITVCDRWINSFTAFYADMGPRPSLKHSINRINNDGDYEPDNCEWATTLQQNINQRLRRDNKTGYKGVHLVVNSKSTIWKARIVQKCLGTFPSAIDAARAYNKAAIAKWGKDAKLNNV